MKKGEIWTIDLPQTSGNEQMGARPSVIIAETEANIAIIIPFTSNKQALRFRHSIIIEPTAQNGLKTESIALIFQIRAIDKQRLINKIGEIETKHLNSIDKMLLEMLKLS
ncbi:MAG: putative transcriptional modulator of MazE/toxin,MazF [Ignavibacteria bacterium]|nr:putative transcriptional modulator of MazE/toxin,MazF [Ignavibacteria bacterium]